MASPRASPRVCQAGHVLSFLGKQGRVLTPLLRALPQPLEEPCIAPLKGRHTSSFCGQQQLLSSKVLSFPISGRENIPISDEIRQFPLLSLELIKLQDCDSHPGCQTY